MPANGSAVTGHTATLRWQPVEDASLYSVEVIGKFGQFCRTTNTSTTVALTPSAGLQQAMA